MLAPTWNDLASGTRWRGVVSFIRNWVGEFDSAQGIAAEKLDQILCSKSLSLPTAVREWYLLAGNWKQGGVGVWIQPDALAVNNGAIAIFTDTEGITLWTIKLNDVEMDDPPVFSVESNCIASPSFSRFVAAMVANDVLDDGERAVKLNPAFDRAAFECLVSSQVGDFFTDAPLETATVVIFAYPGNRSAYGKSRTPAGRAILEQLRYKTE